MQREPREKHGPPGMLDEAAVRGGSRPQRGVSGKSGWKQWRRLGCSEHKKGDNVRFVFSPSVVWLDLSLS